MIKRADASPFSARFLDVARGRGQVEHCAADPTRFAISHLRAPAPSSSMGRKKKARVSFSPEEEEVAADNEVQGNDGAVGKDKSLYEILGVEPTASQQEIKKAYYKLALRLHPDKNPGDEEAKEKFQLLQKVISILGDEEKRALYDQTGFVDDDDLVGNAADNLQEFFRAVYRRVTEADIEEFEANYRGSESEKKDLKDLYKKFKGNMNRLFCSMLCSEPKLDSHRFKDIIDQSIDEGELKATKAYQKWAKQISEMKPPTEPLARRSSKEKSDSDLLAIISQRRSQRKEQMNSLLSSIIQECNGNEAPEPSEEEFQRARQRLERNKQGRKRKH